MRINPADAIKLDSSDYDTAIALRKAVLSLGQHAMAAFFTCDDVVKGRTDVRHLLAEAELKEVNAIRDSKMKIEESENSPRAALAELMILDRYFNALTRHVKLDDLRMAEQTTDLQTPESRAFLAKYAFKTLPKLAA